MKALFPKNAFVRFILSSSLFYLCFYLIYQFVVKKYTYYDQRFIGSIINGADIVLKGLGYTTFKMLQDVDLQVIGIDGSGGVWVGSNCNAITLFGLFSIFILCYPGHQRSKLWFIPAGILVIHLLNILRVVILAIIARSAPQWLDFNHTYTFTILIYAVIFGLWMVWINTFANRNKIKTE